MSNIVYIATSIDGYIADKNNQLEWLHDTPNPNNDGSDFGFAAFMQQIDALVMGRNTFEMVASFDCDWPYNKPVFVLSNTLTSVPPQYQNKVSLIKGELKQVVSELNQQGFQRLYIDGGKTVQSFLEQDLIDEMIITTIPVVLGGGVPLFGDLTSPLKFTNVDTKRFLDCLVQNRYVRLK